MSNYWLISLSGHSLASPKQDLTQRQNAKQTRLSKVMNEYTTLFQEDFGMALKFKCVECSGFVVTRFLKIGETAKCRYCGAEVTVPESATETNEEPIYTTTVSGKPVAPEAVAKTDGPVRPLWKVLGLTVITLGIYLWVYLFRTVRELQRAFNFDAQEKTPETVRSALIAYLLITIIGGLVRVGFAVSMGLRGSVYNPNDSHTWLVFSTIIGVIVYAWFWSLFVSLVAKCQVKRGIQALNKSTFWVLILIIVVLSFATIGIVSLAYIGMAMSFVLFFWTVYQVNRIWRAGAARDL